MPLTEITNLSGAGRYGGARVYIPSDLVKDSRFEELFQVGGKVEVTLNPEKKMLEIKPIKG